MGYLNALCKEDKGQLYSLECELPSISRPLYECLLTGIKPVLSGIVNNELSFSKQISIFDLCKNQGLKAGSAAYYWIFELYNKKQFQACLHRHVEDENLILPYGHFYYEDDYLDSHLFADGEHLRKKYNLDFTLIHTMNIDDAGHKFGSYSNEYINKIKKADYIISQYLPFWLEQNINVVITSDHGMGVGKSHGGLSEDEILVPFFTFGSIFSCAQNIKIKQDEICGTICEILGLLHDKKYNQELLKG
ncbi:alkaline phosphatase family protein [Campylobacter hepaticus]|nr:alkaline phosphatase family protein [Campylobacter hepaticus]